MRSALREKGSRFASSFSSDCACHAICCALWHRLYLAEQVYEDRVPVELGIRNIISNQSMMADLTDKPKFPF